MKLILVLFCLFSLTGTSNIQKRPIIFFSRHEPEITMSGEYFKEDKLKTTDIGKPEYKKLAVLLGVDQYKFIRPVTTSLNSVNDLAANLTTHGYDTMTYTDFKTVDFLMNGFKHLNEMMLKENYDVILFYLSGHFDAINEDEYFFLTTESNPLGQKNNYLITGTLHLYNFLVKITRLKSKIKIILFDGPNNIELPGGSQGKQIINNVVQNFDSKDNVLLYSGISDISSVSKNGNKEITLFTEAFINSLNSPNVKLTEAIDQINNYMNQKSGGKFIPIFKNTMPDSISRNFCFSCK